MHTNDTTVGTSRAWPAAGSQTPWAAEVPELANAIVCVRLGQLALARNASDGEGGSDSMDELAEPFAFALDGAYERGATTLLPLADDMPPSLRSTLAEVDEYLWTTRPTADVALQKATRRRFGSPLSESVAAYVSASTTAPATPPPIHRSSGDLLRPNVRVLRRPMEPAGTASGPDTREVPTSSVEHQRTADSPRADDMLAFPAPPPVPRFPLGARPSSPPEAKSSDSSSLSPVAATAPDELDPRARPQAARPLYAAVVGGLAVAAAAMMFVWNPASTTGQARPHTRAALMAPLARPPVELSDTHIEAALRSGQSLERNVAEAAVIVGKSAASVCASGTREGKDARVLVAFDPSGLISARVDHAANPIDLTAAACLEQAFSRQRIGPYDGDPVTRAVTVRLEP